MSNARVKSATCVKDKAKDGLSKENEDELELAAGGAEIPSRRR